MVKPKAEASLAEPAADVSPLNGSTIQRFTANANAACPCRTNRRNAVGRCRPVPPSCRLRSRRTRKAFCLTSSSRSAGRRRLPNGSSGRVFRCPCRTSGNEIRKSAWRYCIDQPGEAQANRSLFRFQPAQVLVEPIGKDFHVVGHLFPAVILAFANNQPERRVRLGAAL